MGKQINFGLIYNQLEVVGIVGHVKQFGLDEGASTPVEAQFYVSRTQLPTDVVKFFATSNSFVVRTTEPPLAVTAPIRDAVREMNGQNVVCGVRTVDEIISQSLAARRFAMILLAVFAVAALALASIGIYGVISYVAGQRTHEIGIRLALGAQRRDVLRLVLGQGARLAVIGLVIGLAAAAGLTRLMTTMLFGVSTVDPLTFSGVAIVLMMAAVAACYIPARRAMRVGPMVALRYE